MRKPGWPGYLTRLALTDFWTGRIVLVETLTVIQTKAGIEEAGLIPSCVQDYSIVGRFIRRGRLYALPEHRI